MHTQMCLAGGGGVVEERERGCPLAQSEMLT